MVVSDFYLIKTANYTVTSDISDPFILESQLDPKGIYKSMDWSISLISGDPIYCFITNDLNDIPTIDPEKCIKISGATSIVEIGRARYLALFVGDSGSGSDSSADSAEVNILGAR